jgi:hypothetical protein
MMSPRGVLLGCLIASLDCLAFRHRRDVFCLRELVRAIVNLSGFLDGFLRCCCVILCLVLLLDLGDVTLGRINGLKPLRSDSVGS